MVPEAHAPEQVPRPLHRRFLTGLHERLFPSHFTDGLTGLGNRASFENDLNRAIAQHPGNVALAAVDLDNFKQTNDTYGHDAGDQMLTMSGVALSSSIRTIDVLPNDDKLMRSSDDGEREPDIVYRKRPTLLGRLAIKSGFGKAYRWGGDEFFAILVGVNNPDDLERITERVDAKLAKVGTPGSVGGALHEQGMTAKDVTIAADTAAGDKKKERKAQQRQEEIAAAPLLRQIAYYTSGFLATYSRIDRRRR
jgi:GGDEF domain-containing protein